MGSWLSRKLKKAAKKLKKIKLRDVAKAVSKVADLGSKVLPSPFSKVSGLVEKSVDKLRKVDRKVKRVKKVTKTAKNQINVERVKAKYKKARSHYKTALKLRKNGKRKQAYAEYKKALKFKKEGDRIRYD